MMTTIIIIIVMIITTIMIIIISVVKCNFNNLVMCGEIEISIQNI